MGWCADGVLLSAVETWEGIEIQINRPRRGGGITVDDSQIRGILSGIYDTRTDKKKGFFRKSVAVRGISSKNRRQIDGQTSVGRWTGQSWLKKLPGKPVFVGYPAAYDFMFVYWYLMKFAGESPFSHSALDIKSYAMAVLKTEFRETAKRKMPKHWFDELPHTHVALDDAIEQGALFINIFAENR